MKAHYESKYISSKRFYYSNIMKPKDLLTSIQIESYMIEHPHAAEHYKLNGTKPAVKQFNTAKASGLEKAICTVIKACGWQAEIIKNMGRPVDNRKTYLDVTGHYRTVGSIDWIKGSGTNGTADVSATMPLNGSNGFGVSVKIEVKIGRDRQSEAQKKYEAQIKATGGVYIIAKTLDDFMAWFVENADFNYSKINIAKHLTFNDK